MSDVQTLLRKETARLLDEQIVDLVIGFEECTTPLRSQPAFIRSSADADKLVINGFCQNNLAGYLKHLPRDQKIGLCVRGCESRSVHALVVEKQHPRDKLFLIGIPCHGILDLRKIQLRAGTDILTAEDGDHDIKLTTPKGKLKLDRHEFLHDSCLRCLHPNPVNTDLVLGEPLPEGDPALARQPQAEFEKLSTESRFAFFESQAGKCIGCYACREACPMCYCEECFVDHTAPRWKESMVTPAGTQAWQIVRAFHQTGRCVSCGACERACPMDIKMTYLTDKLNEDMRRLYGFEVGMNDETQPPFASFTLDDKNRFVG